MAQSQQKKPLPKGQYSTRYCYITKVRLGKSDAPLKVQFERGKEAFKLGGRTNPHDVHTMRYREWERGYNSAYSSYLIRNKRYESARRG